LGAAGIRRVSIDVVLLEWRIRKQRGNPDAMMKAARIVNQRRRNSEASKLFDFLFGAEVSSNVAVDSCTAAST
jgi:alpha/beta superfamily hydrolase